MQVSCTLSLRKRDFRYRKCGAGEGDDHGAFSALVVVVTCDPNARIPAETADFVTQVIVPHLES